MSGRSEVVRVFRFGLPLAELGYLEFETLVRGDSLGIRQGGGGGAMGVSGHWPVRHWAGQ
jgi:hypothetical protein